MNIDNVREILKERIRISKETQDNWDYGIEKCWSQLIEALSEDIDKTIHFLLNECTSNEYVWISEVFEEIAEKTQSREFISTLYQVANKYPEAAKEYYLLDTIKYAESQINN